MRILILGAGAVGGYFGGRMSAEGSDITFLVRDARAGQLKDGLKIESPLGDTVVPVKTITEGSAAGPFDLILVTCKAYGLAGALNAIAPYVRDGVHILPLLNGIRHLETIEAAFPMATIWGGTAGIVATLTEAGVVRQMLPNQFISFGARQNQTGGQAQLDALATDLARAGIDGGLTADIELVMWEKWSFLTTLAAATCLMNGAIGQILATDYGETLIARLFDECTETAKAEGFPPGPNPTEDYRALLFNRSSAMTASMLRDMNAGAPTEADHIIGDMIRRAQQHDIETPLLRTAFSRLQLYENAQDA